MTDIQIKEARHRVELELKNATNSFYLKIYDGELPKIFLEVFGKSLFSTPPIIWQLAPKFAIFIKNKRLDELTRLDVAKAINIIKSSSPDKWSTNVDESLDFLGELEAVEADHNKAVSHFEKELNRRKAVLEQLNGLAKNTTMMQPVQKELNAY